MPPAISCEVSGFEQFSGNLRALKEKVRQKLLKKAVTAGSNVIARRAKAKLTADRRERKVRNRNRLMRKAIGAVIRTYRGGTIAVGVIGPRKGFREQVGVRTRDGKKSKKGDPIYEDPANIAHLVEFGHGGPHPAPPHPFMRPAIDEGRNEAEAKMADVIRDGIEGQ